METITIDARGLACPMPVVKTKKALAQHSNFCVLVTSDVAKENVKRFLESQKVNVEVEQTDDGYKLKASK